MKRILLILLFVILFSGCQTHRESCPELILPERYEELKVSWMDMPEEGGLFLPYGEYRKLEINIVNMREYERTLELMILGDIALEEV